MADIKPSEITPEHVYLSRRKFMVGIGSVVAGSLLLSACGGSAPSLSPAQSTSTSPSSSTDLEPSAEATTDELGEELTSFQAVTNYNNFYEFTVRKEGVAGMAQDFRTSPWSVAVGGLVHQDTHHGRIGKTLAGGYGVLEMEIDGITFTDGSGDAPLGILSVAFINTSLGYQENVTLLPGQQGGIEPSNAAADNYIIVPVGQNAPGLVLV